jgi:titin
MNIKLTYRRVVRFLAIGFAALCSLVVLTVIESPANAASLAPATTPTAPTSLIATPGNRSVSVAFTPAADGGSNITNYEYSIDDGGTWAETSAGTTSPVRISGLRNGTTYTLKLRAVNAVGNGAASSASTSFTPASTPSTPWFLVAAATTQNSLTLAWTAPTTNGGSPIIDYKIEYSSKVEYSSFPINWVTFNDGVSAATTATVTGLIRGTPYIFRVSATNAIGSGPSTTSRDWREVVKTVSSPAAWCDMSAGGRVTCWDGGGKDTSFGREPVDVGMRGAVDIWGEPESLCALLADGRVDCYEWIGTNDPPHRVTDPDATIALSSGTPCALLADKTIECWGRNNYGQLGNGTTTDSSLPVTVTGITNATTIAIGDGSTCALLTDKTIKCWGKNNYGQLGNGTTTDSSLPVTVTGITNATAIAIGYDNACALLTDNTIKCWGKSSLTPVLVTGITNATDLGLSVSGSGSAGGTTKPWTSGLSSNGNSGSAVIPMGLPTAPGAPVITGKSVSTVSLTWSAPTDAGGGNITDYTIQYSTDGTNWWVFNDGISSLRGTTVNRLTRGTAYTFRVSAFNEVGTGPASTASSVAVPAEAPAAPAAPGTPTLSSRTPTSVTLSWRAPRDGGQPITDYKIEYSSNGVTWVVFADGTSTSTSATVSGLVPGTSYRFRISAINSVGTGTSSSPTEPIIAATAPQTPKAPTVVITGTTGGRVIVSWTAPANGGVVITGYEVIATGGATPIVKTITNAATLSQAFTGLSPTTRYRFTVKATNAIGTSAASPGTSLVPAAVPAKPDSVWFVSAGNGSISVAYTAPASNGGSAITGYLVQAFTPSTTSAVISSCQSNATTLTCTVTGLTNGVRYELRVYAKNIAGASTAFSKLVNVKAGAAPAAPRSRL